MIALVITIIVLLILAGITINMVLSDEGIMKKAQDAEERSNIATDDVTKGKITLTDEYDSIFTRLSGSPYMFEIDRSIKIASIDGVKVGDSGNPPQDPTLISGESDLINDFNIEIKNKTNSKIEIQSKEVVTATDNSKIAGYIYFINGEAVDVSNQCIYTYSGLTKNTEYNNIYAVAIDKNGKLKKSSNVIKTSTTDVISLSTVCKVGELVQYSADNISYWKIWNINEDGSVQIIADTCVEQYNPVKSYASAEAYLGNNENWKKYENNLAVQGSALGATTKEMYEKNYKIDPTCSYIGFRCIFRGYNL